MLIKRGKLYHSRIMLGGYMRYRSLRTRDKQEALRREAAFRIELTSGDFGLTSGEVPTLAAFEERFFNALALKVRPRTLEYYRDAWKPLIAAIGGTRIDRITPALIETFVQGRSKRCATATVNHSLRTLRRALRLAQEWNLIRKVPRITLRPHEHMREFTIDETLLARMLNHETCSEGLKTLLPFLIDTGLRIGEALALEWNAVDLKKATVRVKEGKTRFSRRTVPLTNRALSILKGLTLSERLRDRPVFEFGKYYWISHQFKALRTELGLPKDCVLHSTRHTFCTRLGSEGVDAFTLQRLAGHSSITVSARYVHPDAENMANAIARLNR